MFALRCICTAAEKRNEDDYACEYVMAPYVAERLYECGFHINQNSPKNGFSVVIRRSVSPERSISANEERPLPADGNVRKMRCSMSSFVKKI